MLFDLVEELGIGPGHLVLDVGSKDARRQVERARRTGCRSVGIEPVADNVDRARAVLATADPEVAARVRTVRGLAEALPFPDGAFDPVWCRDVLVHVAPLELALSECRRVTRTGGRMVVFNMFATPWLEPSEAVRLWPPLAAVERNTDPAHVEACMRGAGWSIERVDELKSEWREFEEESGSPHSSKQLLRVARLLRDPDRYREAIGPVDYDVEVADCLWGVYQMIGKLSPRVYVLAATMPEPTIDGSL